MLDDVPTPLIRNRYNTEVRDEAFFIPKIPSNPVIFLKS